MRNQVTVHMAAPASRIWAMISDVTMTGRFSPETFEAEWLDGATGPAIGTRFRGHVKRNGRGPVYRTVCRITACEPDREFGFAVLFNGAPINNWHYRLVPTGAGTDVTESYELSVRPVTRIYRSLFGRMRDRTNVRDMRETLERIRDAVEEG